MKQLNIVVLAYALLSFLQSANGDVIYWTTNGNGPPGAGGSTVNDAVGNPDEQFYGLPVSASATFADFSLQSNYGDFASLFGINSGQQDAIDFFIYERNGVVSNLLFETSTFEFFSNGQTQLTVNYSNPPPYSGDPSPHASIVKQGNLSNSSFDAFFGTNLVGTFGSSNSGGGDVPYLLFDLDSFGVDPKAADFSLTITGGNNSDGTPDIGGSGSFTASVPEPSALVLFSVAAAGFSFVRIRRRSLTRNSTL